MRWTGALFAVALVASALSVNGAKSHEVSLPALGASDGCNACLVAVRILNDLLCDEYAVEFLVDVFQKNVCPVTPDKEQCSQLAEALMPVAVEWLRASATPAEMCAAAGVCGTALLQDAVWDKPAKRLKDGFGCPVCKHVMGRVRDSLRQAAADGSGSSSNRDKVAFSAVSAACAALPSAELVGECRKAFADRERLLTWAAGVSSTTTTTSDASPVEVAPEQACEALGMCVEGLSRFTPPPLPPALAQHLLLLARAIQTSKHASASVSLVAGPMLSAFGDNRCDICKLTVLEVATLLANPGFQDALRTYGESMCSSTVPPSYEPLCKAYVDTYVPVLLNMLQQYVQPDVVCQRMHMCPPPQLVTRGSSWFSRVVGVLAGSGQGQQDRRRESMRH